MTPAARVATAIEILESVASGMAAERAFLRWSRSARHAGSKDRAAVRDHVFDAMRRWWSSAAMGGGETGRARMIGVLREDGGELGALFDGSRYGPPPLTDEEAAAPPPADGIAALDCPEWLAPDLQAALGEDFRAVMGALRFRAPVFLRANLRKCDRAGALAALDRDGIAAVPHPLSPTAIEVIGNARGVARSRAYLDGRVEIQDAASQAVVDMLPLAAGLRVLDYCAGGGGKTLAMAGRCDAAFYAHDMDAARLGDLAPRARRAGVDVRVVETAAIRETGPFDLVVVDAPCSGSGAWRRSPEGKLRLARARLDELSRLQRDILAEAAEHVAPGGTLAYATCSLLHQENGAITEAFLRDHPSFAGVAHRKLTPLDGGDGFYAEILCHA